MTVLRDKLVAKSVVLSVDFCQITQLTRFLIKSKMAFPVALSLLRRRGLRYASTQTHKASGDISSVFPSLQPGYKPKPLAPRFAELKKGIFEQNGAALTRSYDRLLQSLEHEVQQLKAKGSEVCINHDTPKTFTSLTEDRPFLQ